MPLIKKLLNKLEKYAQHQDHNQGHQQPPPPQNPYYNPGPNHNQQTPNYPQNGPQNFQYAPQPGITPNNNNHAQHNNHHNPQRPNQAHHPTPPPQNPNQIQQQYEAYPTLVRQQQRGVAWTQYRPVVKPRDTPKPPFGLVPAKTGEAPPKATGVRKAVIIGINYTGTKAKLRGCINDAKAMKNWLVSQGFNNDERSMVVLTDDQRDGRYQPTRANIEKSMQWLVAGAQPGDVLFFHYSGHGAQQRDPTGQEADGMDETILPVDFKKTGQITDNTIFNLLVWPLPSGVKLTAVMDCCHSGTGMDLPFICEGRRGFVEDLNPNHSLGDVVLFSASADNQVAADAALERVPGGAMTTAFLGVVQSRRGGSLTYAEMQQGLASILRKRGFRQKPQLSSSQRFSLDTPFSFDVIIPNSNPHVGRQFRRKGKRALDFKGTGLGTLLLVGVGAWAGLELLDGLGDMAFGGLDLLGGF